MTPALERCNQFDSMLDRLEKEGVRISDSSRFRFYGKLLRAFGNSGVDVVQDLTEDEAMRIGIASAEVGELLEAVDMLLRAPCVEGWLPRFQVAVGGQAIPVDGPDTARAAQFELVVAASCRKAGAQPLFGEPDVKVRVDRRMLYIAAKRIVSASQFDKRTAEARDQIVRAAGADPKAQGIIAYDLTPMLGFDRAVGRAVDLQEVGRMYTDTFKRVSDTGRRVGRLAIKEPRVRVAAIYARFSVRVTLNKSFADVRPWYCGPVPADRRVAAPLRRFLDHWGSLSPPP